MASQVRRVNARFMQPNITMLQVSGRGMAAEAGGFADVIESFQ